jgi:phage-related protein
MTYKINGTDISTLGVVVTDFSGLFDALEAKSVKTYEVASQHGVMVKNDGIRYKERVINLELLILAENAAQVISNIETLMLSHSRIRLERINEFDVKVWDCVYDKESSREYYHENAERVNIVLIEPAPIKRVYKSTGSFSITSAAVSGSTQQPLLISCGDYSLLENKRAGTHTHTYTDGYDSHYVIVSGVLDEVTLSGLTNLTLLYSVDK